MAIMGFGFLLKTEEMRATRIVLARAPGKDRQPDANLAYSRRLPRTEE